jgi:Glyoxalase/Bleomycin resistance protein/Dioxygenase superfamily
MAVLGKPVQIAYAVRDVRAAAARWAENDGAGPFFVNEHIPVVKVRYRGGPGSFDHSSAYGQWGDVMVELVQDHTVGRSPVRDVVGDGGEGLHHVAFFVDDLADAQAELSGRGWPEALYAETASGAAFVFHDAVAELGHMVELYVGSRSLRGFYAMVADAAKGWDGSDPVRSVQRG